MMAKAVIQASVLGGATLAVLPGATIEIRDEESGALTQLWTDRAGTTTTTNPTTSDINGFFRVYANPGRYRVTATLGALTREWRDVIVDSLSLSSADSGDIRETIGANYIWLNGIAGADPTGAADNQDIVDAAVTEAIATGKTIRGRGRFLINQIVRTSLFDLKIEGDETEKLTFVVAQAAADAGSRGFKLEPAESEDVTGFTLSAAVKPNQRSVVLTSVVGLAAGMVMQITSDTLWYHDPRGEDTKGEIHYIRSVDSGTGTVYFTDPTRDSYNPSTESLTIKAWTPSKLFVQNVNVEMPATTAGTAGFQYSKCLRPEFRNVRVNGVTAWGILGMKCWHARYQNVHFYGLGLANSNGYGVQDKGGVGTIIESLYAWGCRRAVDFHGLSGTNGCVSRDWQVSKFVVHGGGAHYPDTASSNESYGLGMHGPTENGIFRDGIITDCLYGINCRSRSITIDNVIFKGTMLAAVSASYGTGLTVRNCTTDRGDYPDKLASFGDAVSGSGISDFIRFGVSTGTPDAMWDFTLPTIIENNVCKGLTESFVRFMNDVEPTGIVQRGNYVQATPGSAGTFTGILAASAAVDVYIKRSYWEDLPVELLEGSYLPMSSTVILGYSTTDADRATRVNVKSWEVRINDDSVAYIRGAVVAGRRILTSINADATGRGIFALTPENATLTNIGGLGASFVGTATGSSMTGTTGTDGNITIGLMNSGDLWVENRGGSNRTFRVTVLG